MGAALVSSAEVYHYQQFLNTLNSTYSSNNLYVYSQFWGIWQLCPLENDLSFCFLVCVPLFSFVASNWLSNVGAFSWWNFNNAVNWWFLCCSQTFWCNTTACTCAQPKHRDAGESCFLTIDLLVLLHCCKIFICMQHLLLTSVFHPSKCRALACCLKAYLVLLLVPLFLCKKAMSYEFVMSQNGNVYLKVFLLCSKVSSSCLLVFPYWFCG